MSKQLNYIEGKKKPAKSSTKLAAGEYPSSLRACSRELMGLEISLVLLWLAPCRTFSAGCCLQSLPEPSKRGQCCLKKKKNGMISWSGIAGSIKFQALGCYPGSQALCRAHLWPELSSSDSNWDKGEIFFLCWIWLNFSIIWNIFKDLLFKIVFPQRWAQNSWDSGRSGHWAALEWPLEHQSTKFPSNFSSCTLIFTLKVHSDILWSLPLKDVLN